VNHPDCPHCGYENDTHHDMCAVCEEESEIGFNPTPFYDGDMWNDVYASLRE
jgi:hypothetical protein